MLLVSLHERSNQTKVICRANNLEWFAHFSSKLFLGKSNVKEVTRQKNFLVLCFGNKLK